MRASVLAILGVVACGDGKPVVAPIVVAQEKTSPASAPPEAQTSSAPPPVETASASMDADAGSDAPRDTSGPSGLGRLGGGFTGQASPTLRQGNVTVKGKLPPEVVQRIVRQNFGRFRLCYESGLRSNPNLAGRVAVKFTITAAGTVAQPSDGGSTMPDKSVVTCVVSSFTSLAFPQPAAGDVSVLFPIVFSPP